jgi:C1A family cysteine protease
MFTMIALSMSFASFAAINVTDVNNKIISAGAKWTARSSWVSELSPAEQKRLMGSRDVVVNNLDYTDAYSKSMTYESVDWRNMNGVNWLGDIMNQGNCGSCVAFATIATLEAQTSISMKAPWLRPMFSPQALFACGGGGCDMGWYTDSGASTVKSQGVLDNACAPYTMGSDGKDVKCTNFCANQTERTYKNVTGTYKPSGGWGSNSVQAVKDALKKGPLVTSMTVYEDFLVYGGGIYKSTSNKSVGGHAISIVGYNDAERYWIIRNSWTEDWGEKGFARISWDDKSGVGSSTIGFQIDTNPNPISIVSPKENDYVSGDVKVGTQSLRSDDVSIKLMKNGVEVEKLQSRHVNTLKSETLLQTSHLADGNYELVAVSSKDNSKSVVRGFSVANSVPSMNISMQMIDADPSKLSGRPEFNVQVSSSPIMMQKIDFVVTNLSGKLITKRTTDVVLKNMKLGFRTNSIPNGQYYFFFRGYYPAAGKVYTSESSKLKVNIQN